MTVSCAHRTCILGYQKRVRRTLGFGSHNLTNTSFPCAYCNSAMKKQSLTFVSCDYRVKHSYIVQGPTRDLDDIQIVPEDTGNQSTANPRHWECQRPDYRTLDATATPLGSVTQRVDQSRPDVTLRSHGAVSTFRPGNSQAPGPEGTWSGPNMTSHAPVAQLVASDHASDQVTPSLDRQLDAPVTQVVASNQASDQLTQSPDTIQRRFRTAVLSVMPGVARATHAAEVTLSGQGPVPPSSTYPPLMSGPYVRRTS